MKYRKRIDELNLTIRALKEQVLDLQAANKGCFVGFEYESIGDCDYVYIKNFLYTEESRPQKWVNENPIDRWYEEITDDEVRELAKWEQIRLAERYITGLYHVDGAKRFMDGLHEIDMQIREKWADRVGNPYGIDFIDQK